MHSTRQVIETLRNEGRRVGMDRIQRLIIDGQLFSPPVIGGARVWGDSDVARLRRLIDERDGRPTAPATTTPAGGEGVDGERG